jgi:H+/Na+-translocating ferredoxin:NAD+ oxidoreductase subunit B
MGENLYRDLQKQLDTYSVGFPETESGIEIKILKKLFNDDDAKIFLKLTPMLETPADIAKKIEMSEGEAVKTLEDMSERGLLFRLKKGDQSYYGAIPFVHGLFEFQVKRLDKEFAEMVEELMREKMHENMQENAGGFLRTIPVDLAVDPTLKIAAYEDVEEILKEKDVIVVTDCICRKQRTMVSEGCGKPMEACFMFGSMAQYYIDHDMGRKIDMNEALKIVKEAQAAGLVTQPASAQNPAGMCNCCGDCCGVLQAVNDHPRPADIVFSNYYAKVDQDECSACEECLDRCQVNAIYMNDDDKAEIKLERCIGCGLCVTTCSTEAISLVAKDEKELKVPPKNSMEQMINMAKKRGVL